MAIINRSFKAEDKQKPTRYFSSNQEKAIAKKFGGKQTKNSGATLFEKSDVLLDNINLECKTKTSLSESISIKKSWLEKNKSESILLGKKYSALAFNFGPNQQNYYIIDEELFEILISKIDHIN